MPVIRLFAIGLVILTACGGAEAASRKSRVFTGVASYYNQPGRVASGGRYTAAHRSLPFGTRLRVTDPKSGRTVHVVVNDRGPFKHGRVLDLSLAAARDLRMTRRGLMRVRVAVQ